MSIDVKSIKAEMHDLVDQLSEDAVAEALAYLQRLVDTDDADSTSRGGDLDPRWVPWLSQGAIS